MHKLAESGTTKQYSGGDVAFLSALGQIVGDKHVVTDPDLLAPWLTDWRGRYTGRPIALASPASTAELAAIMSLCAAEGVPVVTQGGNSGMVGGATPDESGCQLLLSTRRLTELQIDAPNKVAECGAGVVLQHLHEAAERGGPALPTVFRR